MAAFVPAKGQWQLGVKYVLLPGANTRVFLAYNGPESASREFTGAITFFDPENRRPSVIRQISLKPNGPQRYIFDFFLEPGQYLPDLHLTEPKTGFHATLRPEGPYLVAPSGFLNLSDIFLSTSPYPTQAQSAPYLESSLDLEQKLIHFWVEMACKSATTADIRFVVYKEVNQGKSQLVSGFTSVHQTQRPVTCQPGQRIILGDTLSLSGLEPGEYLVIASIVAGNEVKTERSLRFEFGGDLRQRIFSDLGLSIRMMKYLLPQEKIAQLLAIADPRDQREAFLSAWNTLYRNERDDEMVAYYRRIFAANERFADSRAGWETDRGKIFMQYGEPGQQIPVKVAGGEFERWTYPKWSLTFLFKKVDGDFYLQP